MHTHSFDKVRTWFVCRQCAVTSIDLRFKKRGPSIVLALHILISVVFFVLGEVRPRLYSTSTHTLLVSCIRRN